MFCKSGILIFIFAENNYSIYAHTMLIKTPLLHQSSGPRVFLFLSFFLFLALSLFFRLIPWSAEALLVHFPAQASKTLSRRCSAPSPHWEGAWGLREQSKPCAGAFLAFSVNKEYQPLSLLYFLIVDSGPPSSGPLKDLNTFVLLLKLLKCELIKTSFILKAFQSSW